MDLDDDWDALPKTRAPTRAAPTRTSARRNDDDDFLDDALDRLRRQKALNATDFRGDVLHTASDSASEASSAPPPAAPPPIIEPVVDEEAAREDIIEPAEDDDEEEEADVELKSAVGAPPSSRRASKAGYSKAALAEEQAEAEERLGMRRYGWQGHNGIRGLRRQATRPAPAPRRPRRRPSL